MDADFPPGTRVILENPVILAHVDKFSSAFPCAIVLSTFGQQLRNHETEPFGTLPLRQLQQYRDEVIQGMRCDLADWLDKRPRPTCACAHAQAVERSSKCAVDVLSHAPHQ